MIVTGASRRRIAPEFQAVIARAVERVSAVGPSHSVYVYGSVATGTARVGSSDVDLVTVGLDSATAARIGKDLSAEFASLCRGVDIGAAQLSDYDGPGAEAYGNRVFLRHYCVHLAGLDVGIDLSRLRVSSVFTTPSGPPTASLRLGGGACSSRSSPGRSAS